jgi:hypothetical protein
LKYSPFSLWLGLSGVVVVGKGREVGGEGPPNALAVC